MWTRILVLVALLFAAFSCPAQQSQDNPAAEPKPSSPSAAAKIPPEALKVVNPVKPTAASLAVAKKKYGYDCAMCHGTDGDGKGDLAVDMKAKLLDYRDPAALKDKTDGELFYIIKNGVGDMPSEGERAKPDELWNLVIYIRSFAKKERAPKPKSDAP